MTLADDIAQVFQEAAPVFADAFHESTYELLQRVSDGNGGWSDAAPVVVEGPLRCAFGMTQTASRVQRGEDIYVSLSPYSVELPNQTIATSDHLIRINGRTFFIDDVKRGGPSDMFAFAGLQERST